MPAKVYKLYVPCEDKFEIVSKECYYSIYRPVWAKRKRMQRAGECICPRKALCKCLGDCIQCSYYNPKTISLDAPIYTASGEAVSLYDAIPDENEDIEGALMDAILLDELHKALEELDPEGRRMLQLLSDGYSENKAAEIMNIPRTTFQRHWKKLQSELQERLAEFYYD